MDQRRAAGALLALVVCIASTAAAPTASNQTALDLYDGSVEGCYYNFQHYGEGDRIMTNEPCLNCTCHNRMLMCYLRVCPFTKPIGQDCTVEKRADQCCPIVTCPDVPVDLLTSTSTTSPAEYGATGLGKLDKYGCSLNGKYFPEGSKVPQTLNKPCEHCYCIRNMTTCVMQECTLHVDGCTPIYHKDVCCPVRYSCDHPEDSTLLLDDMTTTVRPTPGFLLTTTTLSPVTQMTQDCVHDDRIFPDGALIKTEKACEHCYCMKGDIVCVVQECGTPMENEGKNCTSEPPREGQCCPDTYICEGDEVTMEPSEFSTQSLLEELTTLSPPRRVGVEGSGYRNEPDEPTYTEIPSMETEPEGSGYEQPTEPAADNDSNLLTSETPESSGKPMDESLYPSRTTVRTLTLEEVEKTTEPDKGLNTVPSDASDEEMYKPSITEKTPFEDSKVTETTLASDKKPDETEEKATSPEYVFSPVVTIKSEESLSTTESAFRKEDTFGGPTEIYDLGESDKVSTQAIDIETETEEDVAGSKTKAPFMEELERQTTLSPDYTLKETEQEIPSKESTTESVLDVTTSADVKSTDKLTSDSVELGQTETTKPTVDKIDMPETTSSDQNEIEDISTTLSPGRIPGEGDCLLNDITYRNNSNVPSSNNCHTSCRCVSSIVKCDPIICSPPPEYMDNCQPTYDSLDSCCPTYVCHTGETMPPQSHSQMSGTDSPLPSAPIDCHGDECEVSKDGNVPVIGDCGSAGCGDEHSGDCHDGKCSSPVQPCIGGSCQETPPAHCENGKCGIEPEIVPVKDIPLCENEPNCNGTVPKVPEPHIQMSGTDRPLPSSTMECHDGECEVKKGDNIPVVGDCGPAGCGEKESEISELPPEDCHDGKCSLPVQPCKDGNCQETPTAHCENGKCGIEPEIVPHCENESDCKGTVPEIPPCEGEGCVSVNIPCSGTDCSTDATKHPAIPGQDEGSCEGECKTPEDEIIQPCTETSCRRKETGEVDASLPSQCSGLECIQQVPSKEEDINILSTALPVTEDTAIKSTQQLEMTTVGHEIETESPEMVEHALEEGSTGASLSPATEVPELPEDKLSETKPSIHTTESQLDKEDIVTKSPQADEEYLSTSKPQISVTDETTISDTDTITKESQETATKIQGVDIQTPVTESQYVTTNIDLEETLQTTQHRVYSESTESPQTEIHNIHMAGPQEFSTRIPEIDVKKTELPEPHEEFSTKAPEQEQTESLIPQKPDQADVDRVTEGPVVYTPEIDIASTKIPESDVEKGVTESHVTGVTDVSSHDATESNEVVDKATKASETVDASEQTITTEMSQNEPTTEGAILVSGSQEPEIDATSSEKVIEPFTNAPTESHLADFTESVTKKVSEASTAKPSEDTSDVTSENSEIYKTEKHEPFTESPGEYITESQELSTKQPALPGQEPGQTELPEFTTDEMIREPEVHISEEDTRPQITSAVPVTDTKVKVTTLPSDTEVMEEGTTQTSVSEVKTTISQPTEKPITDNEKEQPAESPDTNDVTLEIAQKPSEKPATASTVHEVAEESDSEVTIVDKTVTVSSTTFLTEQPTSKIPVDDYKTDAPEQITESTQEITEQQEVSTEELPILPVTNKTPTEPYIPVQPEITPGLATTLPDIINKMPDVEQDIQTPVSEIATKIPDRSGMHGATEIPENMDTESSDTKVPETTTNVATTQSSEVFFETQVVEDKNEQPRSTIKPTTDAPDDFSTKEELETKTPAVDEVPEKTPATEIIVSEQQEKESVTTERMKEQSSEGEQGQISELEKYSTVSVIQETTVPSVTQQDSSKQSTEREVMESDSLYTTSAPESHVKEPQEPVTQTAETLTTKSHDMGVSVPHEKLSPDETVTEGHEVSLDTPEKKPIEEIPDKYQDEKHKAKPELPKDTYTRTPDEISTVLLEVITKPPQEVIPVKPQEFETQPQEEDKTPEDKVTEKPEKETPSVSGSPDDSSTVSPIELDTVVTEPTQYKVTETHVDVVTSAISPDEQEKITTDGFRETMMTILQESSEQPQELSTRIPQDITSLPEKYTIAVSEEATLTTTRKPLGVEDVELHMTTLKTPQIEEQATEGYTQTTVEPTIYGTKEPGFAVKESITDAPVSPSDESADDKHTTPDVVELEEHSHKPVEEISTTAPTDEEKLKPEVTTEKQIAVSETDKDNEYNPEISIVTTMDLGEILHSATLPTSSEESEQHTDIPTTNQPGIQVEDQKVGEDTSQEEHQVTQATPENEQLPMSGIEIPVQTEKVPTKKVTESELSHETTMLEELSPVTPKSTEKEQEESSTQKPEYGKTQETPLSEKPKEQPDKKPSEVLTEKPLEKPIEESEPLEGTEPLKKPVEEPIEESKPLEGTEPLKKPVEEPETKPLEEGEEKLTETPFKETTMTPLATDKPLLDDEDNLIQPIEQTEDKPTKTPEQKPLEEEGHTETPKEKPFRGTEDMPTEIPLEESDKMHEEKPEKKPLEEAYEKPTETPLEGTDERLENKPIAEHGEKPIVTPQEVPEEKPHEMPEEKPQKVPEGKPQEAQEQKPELPKEKPELPEEKPELPEEEPQEVPEEKLQEVPEEKPQEAPKQKPEFPEEKPELPDEIPQEVPKENTQEVPEEKTQEAPEQKPELSEEKPNLPEEKPQEVPKEKPQEVPEEKPEMTKEKPQEEPEQKPEVSEKKPHEVPEKKPQEEPEQKPEVSEEKPQEEPEQKPEVSEEKPQEVPEEKPQEESELKPEVSEEKPQEEPEQKPEVSEEKPQKVPEEKPQEEPELKPEVSKEKPQEVPEDKPQEEPEQKPEVSEETPQEVPEEKPQEEPELKPEVSEEKPQEVPEDKPQEELEQKPEVPEEKPQEVPEEKPQDKPEQKPELPDKKPQEVFEEKPELPEEKPEVSEEKPQEVPEEKPQEVPEDKPKVPEEEPQEEPEQKPELPEEKPQEMPEEKPEEVPKATPEFPEEKPEIPEEKPQEVPEEKPQELPEEKPEVAEEKPQEVLEEKPEVPKEKPQEMPEKKQEAPKEKPQEIPEQKPQEMPEEKPAEPASTASPDISKPGFGDVQPTDEVPDDDNQFPPSAGTSGYGTEPDYVEEDQAFGPGTCRYGGKVYVSAQQIPRDDPCDFCFCFRSDIICLQQSCPPPIHGCHEEPIQGFCCPRYECPVAMATTLNVTTTTTTTTTTLPPHFLPHAYKGAAQRRGCQIKGHTYKVGEVVRASSGPCLHCTCGGDGQMKCDPKACTPEPMLRQMIAAAVSAKRRR